MLLHVTPWSQPCTLPSGHQLAKCQILWSDNRNNESFRSGKGERKKETTFCSLGWIIIYLGSPLVRFSQLLAAAAPQGGLCLPRPRCIAAGRCSNSDSQRDRCWNTTLHFHVTRSLPPETSQPQDVFLSRSCSTATCLRAAAALVKAGQADL